jgi:pimeloyl-ACP methyl ester carboxylesterase
MTQPALLFIPGPGVSGRGMPALAPWEAHFEVIHWDQPGPDGGRLTLEQLANAAAAAADAAVGARGAARLAVLGVSGGSVVGLMLAKARPDLVSVFAGSGQFVHWARQAALSYELLLQHPEAAAELTRIGPPPYAELADEAVLAGYAGAFTPAERAAMNPSWRPPAGTFERAGQAYALLRDELGRFDAWALGRRFEQPLVFLQGVEDRYSVTSEVEAYAAWAEAPHAEVQLIEGGGHSAFMLGAPFAEALARHVLPWT